VAVEVRSCALLKILEFYTHTCVCKPLSVDRQMLSSECNTCDWK